MKISQGDINWLKQKGMGFFSIPELDIVTSKSKKVHPDIWIRLDTVPKITVTQEWARQSVGERRKRLVHEMIHIKISGHGEVEGLDYNTLPKLDSYSKKVYKDILRGE